MRAATLSCAALVLGGCDQGPVRLRVAFENLATPGSIVASDGSRHDAMFAPGVWVITTVTEPPFVIGSTASPGLERLAEDGSNTALLAEVEASFPAAGTFAMLDSVSYEESPIGPGVSVSFELDASAGDQLAIASMFVQSNDVFVGSAGTIDLFAEGSMPAGDVTRGLLLLDAGTEVNEEPGLGTAQAPRQPEPGFGTPEAGVITPILDGTDAAGHDYPPIDETLRVTVSLVER